MNGKELQRWRDRSSAVPATKTKIATIDISESTTVSTNIDAEGYQVVGLRIPADFEGTEITFQVLPDIKADGTAYDPGTDTFSTLNGVTLTVSAGNAVNMSRDNTWAWRYLKIVATTTQTTTDKDIEVVMRAMP